MECAFILPALVLLLFLPFPPRRQEIGSFAVLSIGIIGAALVWWGLRAPTRIAWWGALTLSVAWLLASFSVFWVLWKILVAGLTGRVAFPVMDNALVLSSVFALVPAIAQTIILLAWLRGATRG